MGLLSWRPLGTWQSSVLTQVSVVHTIPAKQLTASPSSLVHLFFYLIDQIFMGCLLSDLMELMYWWAWVEEGGIIH